MINAELQEAHQPPSDGQLIADLTDALRNFDGARLCECWDHPHQRAAHRAPFRYASRLVERAVLTLLARVVDPPIVVEPAAVRRAGRKR